MKQLSRFTDDDKKTALSLSPVEEMALRVLFASESYGYEIASTIRRKSDNCIPDEKLARIYKVLNKLKVNNLIDFSCSTPGGKERNFHRRDYYKITTTGVETLDYLDSYRARLSGVELV